MDTQRIPSSKKPSEALFIKELRPSLNTQETSVPLKLFNSVTKFEITSNYQFEVAISRCFAAFEKVNFMNPFLHFSSFLMILRNFTNNLPADIYQFGFLQNSMINLHKLLFWRSCACF